MSHVSFAGPGLPPQYDPRHEMKAAAYSHLDHASCNHRLDGVTPITNGDTLTYTCLNCYAYATFTKFKEPAKWPGKAR